MRFEEERRREQKVVIDYHEFQGLLYVRGNTYPIRDYLKSLGARWSMHQWELKVPDTRYARDKEGVRENERKLWAMAEKLKREIEEKYGIPVEIARRRWVWI
mgnify:CR=1 FL=1